MELKSLKSQRKKIQGQIPGDVHSARSLICRKVLIDQAISFVGEHPVVILRGPSLSGKTILAQQLLDRLQLTESLDVLYIEFRAEVEFLTATEKISELLGILDPSAREPYEHLNLIFEALNKRSQILIIDNIDRVKNAAFLMSEAFHKLDTARLIVTATEFPALDERIALEVSRVEIWDLTKEEIQELIEASGVSYAPTELSEICSELLRLTGGRIQLVRQILVASLLRAEALKISKLPEFFNASLKVMLTKLLEAMPKEDLMKLRTASLVEVAEEIELEQLRQLSDFWQKRLADLNFISENAPQLFKLNTHFKKQVTEEFKSSHKEVRTQLVELLRQGIFESKPAAILGLKKELIRQLTHLKQLKEAAKVFGEIRDELEVLDARMDVLQLSEALIDELDIESIDWRWRIKGRIEGHSTCIEEIDRRISCTTEKRELGILYLNKAFCVNHLGDLAEAEKLSKLAASFLQKDDPYYYLNIIRMNIQVTRRSLSESEELLAQAERDRLYFLPNNQLAEAYLLFGIATINYHQASYEIAVSSYSRALQLFRKLRKPTWILSCEINLAVLRVRLGPVKAVQSSMEKIVSQISQINDEKAYQTLLDDLLFHDYLLGKPSVSGSKILRALRLCGNPTYEMMGPNVFLIAWSKNNHELLLKLFQIHRIPSASNTHMYLGELMNVLSKMVDMHFSSDAEELGEFTFKNYASISRERFKIYFLIATSEMALRNFKISFELLNDTRVFLDFKEKDFPVLSCLLRANTLLYQALQNQSHLTATSLEEISVQAERLQIPLAQWRVHFASALFFYRNHHLELTEAHLKAAKKIQSEMDFLPEFEWFDLLDSLFSGSAVGRLGKMALNPENSNTSASPLEAELLRSLLDNKCDLSFYKETHSLQIRSHKFNLKSRPLIEKFLLLFLEHPEREFSKEEIVKFIWAESYNPLVHDSRVYTGIKRLREFVEKAEPELIEVREGLYRLNSIIKVNLV